MSELEKFNNKELSKMCRKFGMPNVPVTQTTRKVIIKRLEVAISDKQYSTDKNANHSETVHANAPAKMASSKLIIKDESNTDDRSVKSDNNRSTQPTMAVSECTEVCEKGPTPATENLQPKRPAKELPSKTIALTKSEMVTTSYLLEQLIESPVSAKDGLINQGEPVSFFKPNFTSTRSYENEKKIYYPNTLRTTAPYNTQHIDSGVNVNDFPTHHPTWGFRPDYNYNKTSMSSQQAKQRFVSSAKFLVKPRYVDECDADEFKDEYDAVVVQDSRLSSNMRRSCLNKFERNLENLKAPPPLADKYSPFSSPPGNLRQREPFRHRLDTSSLRVTSPTSDANIGSFMQLASALGEKYHFKWPLFFPPSSCSSCLELLAQAPRQDYYKIVIGPQVSVQQFFD
uniref:LEM domain-containing protein n=1 Tax=Glossina austeni TaxID=7395 RepID=A0A1A9UV86_GLOAU